MRLSKLFILISVVLTNSLIAQNEIYENANTAFQNGDYKQAVIGYEKLLVDSFTSANLYYNLGNAYYKLDEVGKTILYYEKALKLSPSLPEAQHNLQLAYLKSENQIEPLPKLFIVEWWQSLLSKKTASKWAKQGLIVIWIGIVLLMLYRWKKMTWSKIIGVLLLIVGLSFTFLAWQKYNYDYKHQFAIVMVKSTDLKEGPNPESEAVLTAYEGLKLEIIDQVDDWFQVRVEDGVEAWVLRSGVEEI